MATESIAPSILNWRASGPVPCADHYPTPNERAEQARALYREEAAREGIDGIYLRDLLRDEVTDLAGL